jgi:hypothetical protein
MISHALPNGTLLILAALTMCTPVPAPNYISCDRSDNVLGCSDRPTADIVGGPPQTADLLLSPKLQLGRSRFMSRLSTKTQ